MPSLEKIKALLAFLRGQTPVKNLDVQKYQFLHGTTPEAKAEIIASGKFDPHPARWPSYSYSELGADTTYATPKGGWWLDKEKAAAGRAQPYASAIGVDIDPSAKIAHIKSPKDWEKFAKQMGFKNGQDLYRKLSAENLDMYNYAKNLTPEQFKQLEMERVQLRKWLDKDVKPGDFHYTTPEEWDKQIREIPLAREKILKEQSILGPREAVEKIKQKGYQGMYIDKYDPKIDEVFPAPEQLAIFDQSIAKPNPKVGYKKGGLAALKKKKC